MMTRLMDRRRLLKAGLGASVCFAGPLRSARAQIISRNARLLVGFPAGGSIDTVARLITEQMKDYAASLIVENRAGAGGRLALDSLRRSEPDGATLAISPGDQITLFPHIYRTLTYDPLRDFVPVTTVCSFPFVIAVGPMVSPDVRTLADFAAWCRANPQRASYGSAGAGTRPHFLGALFAREAKIEMAHIPFSGGSQALQAVLGGQISATVTVLANVLPQLQAGGLRALATTSPERSAQLPDVQTAREAGFPGIEALEWFGVFLPAPTPVKIVDDLTRALHAALAISQVKAAFAKQAYDSSAIRGEAFVKLIRDDTERWGKIVREAGFTLLD